MNPRAALLVLFALSCSPAALALDKKHLDGSVEVTPDKAALEFLQRYEHAIHSRSSSFESTARGSIPSFIA